MTAETEPMQEDVAQNELAADDKDCDENVEAVAMTTSSPSVPVTPTQTTSATAGAKEVVFNPELLKMYYARLFPFELLHSWLAYDPLNKQPQVFSRREFSFTIEPFPGEEIYIRYQSFGSEDELKQAILKRQPHKIDIGAVFSHPPKDKNGVQNFSTVQRELVFDIDLTDYDDVRNCGCSGAKICNKCWTFMTMAVKVMDQGLREDFGFEQIAWFYSGRRGVHAWVCDEMARNLSNEGRSAVANYFEVSLNNKGEGLSYPLYPMLARALEELEPSFIESVLPETGHGLLASPDQWEPLLDTLPPAARQEVGERMLQNWSGRGGAETSPAEKWQELKQHLKVVFGMSNNDSVKVKRTKNVSTAEKEQIENWPAEVVFKYTYPRLDINVSKMQNHLLKSPFCVHPKTGRVCVPVRVASIEEFDPFSVPTLPQLMKELDGYNETGSTERIRKDWQKTSLKAYFEPFQKEFLEPMIKTLRRQAREESEEQAALTGDF